MADDRINGQNYTVIPRLNVTEDLVVAGSTAQAMVWRGEYISGNTYQSGNVVRAGQWLSIANKQTEDSPVPEPVGSLQRGLPVSPAFLTQNNASIITANHNYTFSQKGYVRDVAVWVPSVGPTIRHRLQVLRTIEDEESRINVGELIGLTPGAWNTINIGQEIIIANTVLTITLRTADFSATTMFSGQWTFTGNSGSNPPVSGAWNRQQNNQVFRVNKIDNSGTDRTAELITVIPDTDITCTQDSDPGKFVVYQVNNFTEFSDYVEYETQLVDSGTSLQANQLYTIDFVVPTPASAAYSELTGYWPANQPAFATVTSDLLFDNAVQPGNTNAYGIDIFFQEADVSPDWDFMAFSSF